MLKRVAFVLFRGIITLHVHERGGPCALLRQPINNVGVVINNLSKIRWYSFRQLCVYLSGKQYMRRARVVHFSVVLESKAPFALQSGKRKHFDTK